MPRPKPTPETIRARFVEKVDSSNRDGCWIWTGARRSTRPGLWYGVYRDSSAHRWSYRLFVGQIPSGLEIAHLCHNSLCVRPEHLCAVTHLENERQKTAAGRRPVGIQPTPCRHCGGPREGIATRGNGRRFSYCVPCKREADHRRAAVRWRREVAS